MSKICGYKTVNMDMCSWHDPQYKFEPGKTHIVKGTKGHACGVGLHFAPTMEGAIDYANDRNNYRMFYVESDTRYLLGKDRDKFRVSHLKLVKEIDYNKALKEREIFINNLNKINPLVLNPKSGAIVSKQKITSVVNSWAKSFKIKNVKIHTTDNLFEALAYARNSSLSWVTAEQDVDNDEGFYDEVPPLTNDFVYNKLAFEFDGLESAVVHIKVDYVQTFHESKIQGLLDLLAAGALPIRISKNEVVVYVPKTYPFKKKPFGF